MGPQAQAIVIKSKSDGAIGRRAHMRGFIAVSKYGFLYRSAQFDMQKR